MRICCRVYGSRAKENLSRKMRVSCGHKRAEEDEGGGGRGRMEENEEKFVRRGGGGG